MGNFFVSGTQACHRCLIAKQIHVVFLLVILCLDYLAGSSQVFLFLAFFSFWQISIWVSRITTDIPHSCVRFLLGWGYCFFMFSNLKLASGICVLFFAYFPTSIFVVLNRNVFLMNIYIWLQVELIITIINTSKWSKKNRILLDALISDYNSRLIWCILELYWAVWSRSMSMFV